MTRFGFFLARAGVICTLAAGALTTAHAASPLPLPTASPSVDAALTAKCKAASFARRPAGQMAATMRDMQIKRCVKNRGVLLD
ncbi:MAG TPA: hypothetical protein VGG01_24820 [Xanthobacteraceae bacterium]|jgi:hypothetical protein